MQSRLNINVSVLAAMTFQDTILPNIVYLVLFGILFLTFNDITLLIFHCDGLKINCLCVTRFFPFVRFDDRRVFHKTK